MVLGLGFALTALTGSLPLWVQYLPLLASVLLLGLPHGAVDHLVLPGLETSRSPSGRSRALAHSISSPEPSTPQWLLAPVAAFSLFILLTLFHWGQGDVYALVELVGVDYLETPARRTLALLVRGGAPMVVPSSPFPGSMPSSRDSGRSVRPRCGRWTRVVDSDTGSPARRRGVRCSGGRGPRCRLSPIWRLAVVDVRRRRNGRTRRVLRSYRRSSRSDSTSVSGTAFVTSFGRCSSTTVPSLLSRARGGAGLLAIRPRCDAADGRWDRRLR